MEHAIADTRFADNGLRLLASLVDCRPCCKRLRLPLRSYWIAVTRFASELQILLHVIAGTRFARF